MSANSPVFQADNLSALEERFIPRSFRRSLQFLRESQESAGGWPRYRGGASVLHETSLAIRAIAMFGDDSLDWLVAAGVKFVRDEYDRPGNDSIEHLIDILQAATAEKNPDVTYAHNLALRLQQSVRRVLKEGRPLTTQSLSEALIALSRYHKNMPLSRELTELLMARRNEELGGWPAADTGTESFIPTAWATRALAEVGTEQSTRAVTGGIYYINSLLEGNWDAISERGGTLAVALGIRALMVDHRTSDETVEAGLSWLRGVMNPDGGWGGGSGETSSIEYTSHVVISFLERGDNRFVPLRTAADAIRIAEQQIQALTAERDRLSHQFEDRVEERCGRVVEERDELRAQLRVETTSIKRLQTQHQRDVAQLKKAKVQQEALKQEVLALRSRQHNITSGSPPAFVTRASQRSQISALILCTLGLVGVSTGVSLIFDNRRWIGVASISASMVFTLLVIAYLFRRQHMLYSRAVRSAARGLRDMEIFRSPVSEEFSSSSFLYDDIVDSFRYAADRFTADVREQLIYRLLRDAAEIPSDLSKRYVRDIVLDLKISPRESQRLEVWLERLLDLEPMARRRAILEVRRTIV